MSASARGAKGGEDKVAKVQLQIRQNALETQDFLRDLGKWEQSVKKRDSSLRKTRAGGSGAARKVRGAGLCGAFAAHAPVNGPC